MSKLEEIDARSRELASAVSALLSHPDIEELTSDLVKPEGDVSYAIDRVEGALVMFADAMGVSGGEGEEVGK